MPLILQPPSCCDICMEDYSCDELARSPHAIDCGHIFCKTCIGGFTPKVCPLCRKSFVIGRKLHVDSVADAKHGSSIVDKHCHVLMERIALVSDEASTAEDVVKVITETSDWISARSDRNDPNSYKPLRVALDSLCRYRHCLNFFDDLAILRAVENDLRKQLQEEREAASKIRNKLETDLKRVSGHLQAEKDRFIAELWAERETSARVRLELGNIVREAAGNIRSLRTENKRLLSELETAETKDRSLTVPTTASPAPLNIQRPQSPCLSLAIAETLKLSGCIYTPQNNQPLPPAHSYFQSVDSGRGDNATTASGLAPVQTLSILKTPFRQEDGSSNHAKPREKSSSSLEDIIKELQEQSRARHKCQPMRPLQGQPLMQRSRFEPRPLPSSGNGSSVSPHATKKSLRLLKMPSTPSFRKNGDVDRRDVEISITAREKTDRTSPVLSEISWEALMGTSDINAGRKDVTPGVVKHRKSFMQRLPHSLSIFNP